MVVMVLALKTTGKKMWHNPLSAGGFLWDLADQAIVRKDKNDSLDTDKHRGADGIVGPYHEKEGSYYAIKEIWSPVYFERKIITDAFDGSFNIENRFHYTNLSKCNFEWQLQKLGGQGVEAINGNIPSPDIKPGEKGVLNIIFCKQCIKVKIVSAFIAICPDNNGRMIHIVINHFL